MKRELEQDVGDVPSKRTKAAEGQVADAQGGNALLSCASSYL